MSDAQTAQVESEILIAAAQLAAGTGQFAISNDPTIQAADVASCMRMKWEMTRSYYAALVKVLDDTTDWTPPKIDAVTLGGGFGVRAQPLLSALLQAAGPIASGNPAIALPALIAQLAATLVPASSGPAVLSPAPATTAGH